jgi:hypothetical protein
MIDGPRFVRLLGLFVGTSIAISLALGTGLGLVGVVAGVALGVSIDATIAVSSPQTARSGFRILPPGLPPFLAVVSLVGLLGAVAWERSSRPGLRCSVWAR